MHAPPSAFSKRAMVAAYHLMASQAGVDILGQGGNAVDAMIATVLAAGVVQPAGSGLGGGGFALLQEVDHDPVVIDFREVAPISAKREMFVDADRKKASRLGGLAVAVPNESNGLIVLHQRYGTLSLKKIAAPAIWLARNGFPKCSMTVVYAQSPLLLYSVTLLIEVAQHIYSALLWRQMFENRFETSRLGI